MKDKELQLIEIYRTLSASNQDYLLSHALAIEAGEKNVRKKAKKPTFKHGTQELRRSS